jgi:hypothetical protein
MDDRDRRGRSAAVERPPQPDAGHRGFSASALAVSVTLLLIAALAIPALAATFVQRARVAHAQRDITAIAAALHRSSGAAPGAEDATAGTATESGFSQTLAGPGDRPKSPRFADWLKGRSEPLRGPSAVGPDPWGNCYLVNVGVVSAGGPAVGGLRSGRAVWVLSAGSNGIIETPYDQPASTAIVGGDDVAVRVW